MKFCKRRLSFLIVSALLVNLISPMTKMANAANNLIFLETVYVDGMEFTVSLDYENEQIVILGENDGQNAEMILQYDGQADIQLCDEKGNIQKYEADIENLNRDDVDVEVYEDNKVIEEYDDYEELIEDVYEGEGAISLTFTLVVGIVFCAVVAATAVKVCEGVAKVLAHVFYNKIEATKSSTRKEAEDEYYPAYVDSNTHTVYVVPNGITKDQASALLKKNLDVYSFDASHARRAITNIGSKYKAVNSQGQMQPECHWYKNKYNYKHFHKGISDGKGGYKKTGSAHSLYGAPNYVS